MFETDKFLRSECHSRHGPWGNVQVPCYSVVIGGFNGSGYVSLCEEYDPIGDSWASKTPMPTARSGAVGGLINNKIYVVSGEPANTAGNSVNEEFDPLGNSWVAKAPLPTRRSGGACGGVINNKLYVISGFNGPATLVTNANAEYDPSLDKWQSRQSIPTARSVLRAVSLGSSLYVLGGNISPSATFTNETDIYTPSGDRQFFVHQKN